MRVALSLALSCTMVACAADPAASYEAAAQRGYTQREEFRDRVAAVEPAGDGIWSIHFELSARQYRIASEFTPAAAALVAQARSLLASKQETYATILVHETAPRVKVADGARSAADPFPWIVVRLGPERDPALGR